MLQDTATQDILFTGGMDTDSDPINIKPGDYIDAQNVRNVYTEGRDGTIENTDSNILVPFTLPSGTNKCIGKYEDETYSTVFYFLWNSLGNHRLLRYIPAQNGNGSIRVILSGSILAFTEWNYIVHVNLVKGTSGDLLYWLNSLGAHCKINIQKADDFQKNVQFKLCFGVPDGTAQDVQYSFLSPSGPSVSTTVTYPNTLITRVDAAEYALSQFNLIPFLTTNFVMVNKGEYLEFTSTVQGIWTIAVTPLGTLSSWYKAINWYPTVTQKTLDVVAWPLWLPPEIGYGYDSTQPDFLSGRTYQFRIRIRNTDGEESSLSMDSKFVYNDRMLPGAHVAGAIFDPPKNFPENFFQKTYDSQEPYNVLYGTIPVNYLTINYSDNGRLFSQRELINSVEILVRNVETETFRSTVILEDFELDGVFKFFNVYTSQALGQAQNAIPYQALPITSGQQEISNDFLFYTNNTIGYDNVALNVEIMVEQKVLLSNNSKFVYLVGSAGTSLRPETFPKKGGQYQMAICYYDRINRDNTAQTNTSLIVDIPVTDPNPAILNTYYTENLVKFSIKHKPPIHATHYSFLRTDELTRQKYIQFVPGITTYTDGDGNPVVFAVGDVQYAFVPIPTGYTFSAGDYFVDITRNNILCSVLGVDGSNLKIRYDTLSYPELKDLNQTVEPTISEIFTPRVKNENELYFEFANTFEILNPGTSLRAHQGGFNGTNQSGTDPEGTPATGTLLFGWDTQLARSSPTALMSEGPAQSLGRPNAVVPENKQVKREVNTVFSEAFNSGSAYNGFGTWNLLSSKDLPVGFGGVQLLKNVDNVLVAVCVNKAFSLYIKKGIIQGQDGSSSISVSDEVIGAIRDLNGTHGTINPESFAINDGLLFWWDAYRGEVCQYSLAGVDVVSKHRMVNFFAQKGRNGIRSPRETYRVLGVIDKPHKQYIISLPGTNVDSEIQAGGTLGYDYIANRWKTRYGFNPEMMCGNGNNFVTFKNGALWLHKPSNSRCRYYDVQTEMRLVFPVNEYPSTDKTYQGVSVEARRAPNFPIITTPVTPVNIFGQNSELLEADFEYENNSWWATFFMNKSTPNFPTPEDALINGEPLQGQTMIMTYSDLSSNLQWIKAVHVHFVENQLTN